MFCHKFLYNITLRNTEGNQYTQNRDALEQGHTHSAIYNYQLLDFPFPHHCWLGPSKRFICHNKGIIIDNK